MTSANPSPLIIHADQEHSGIRMVIFISLFIGFILSFQIAAWLLNALAPPDVQDYTTFLACIGAIPLTLLMLWGLENLLKRVWHSGLSLELDRRGITVHDRRPPAAAGRQSGGLPSADETPAAGEPAILWAANLSQLNWYFKLSGYPRGGRERRASAKWLCLATELNQDGARLNVYAFMSPERAARCIDDPALAFRRLNPAEVYDTSVRSRFGPPSRPEIPNALLHSKDGRHWLAERRRWEYGVELAPQDFTALISFAQANMRPTAADDALSIPAS